MNSFSLPFYFQDPFANDEDDLPPGCVKRRLPCPDLISNRHWPRLLLTLHTLLPEHTIKIPGMSPPVQSQTEAAVGDEPPVFLPSEPQVFVKEPQRPIYYDHLVLRLLPLLEIVFTSFLDNPPPLLQLTRFCHTVAPLFRLHGK